ncbi:MAG: MarR family winged helix-turn-helix transcriptional regulator [Alphaproteobacteria bacterium]
MALRRTSNQGSKPQGKSKPFAIDDFFPHLINKVTMRIAADFHGKAKRLGVTIEKWRVMAVLTGCGPLTITEISKQTSIELSTVSHLLKRMERDRFIVRKRIARDARSFVVDLTPRGRKIADLLLPMARQYEKIALAGLSPRATALLKQQLRDIYCNVERLERDIISPAAARRR